MGRHAEVTGAFATETLATDGCPDDVARLRAVAHDPRAISLVRANLEQLALSLDCADVALVLGPNGGSDEIIVRISDAPAAAAANLVCEPLLLPKTGEVGVVRFRRACDAPWSARQHQIATSGIRALAEHLECLLDWHAADDERARLAWANRVSHALADARSLDDAIDVVLALVCDATHWPYAEAWIPDARRSVLRRAHYLVRAPSLERFAGATSRTCIAPGQGTPGRAWSTGEAITEMTLAVTPLDPRAAAAGANGLRAAFAVPIQTANETVAVLSFLARDASAFNGRLVGMVAPVLESLGTTFSRARADAATQGADRSQRLLLESLAQLVVTTDLRGRIASCNDAFLQAVGDSREDVVGADVFERYTREPRRERVRVWRAIRHRVMEPTELGMFGGDGAWHDMRWHGVVLTGHDGRPVGVTAFGAEVRRSDREPAHRAILADSIDGTEEAIALIDETRRVSWANRRFTDFVGVRREDLIGEAIPTLLRHHPTHEGFRTLLSLCDASVRTRRELMQEGADGRIRCLRATFDPVRDGQGDVMHFLVSLRDVTEETIQERRLQRLSTAIRTVSEGIALTDAAHELTEVNDAYAELHGFRTAHDLRGRPWATWLAPDAAPEFVQEVERALERYGIWVGDVPLRRRDGSEVVARYSMTALDDGGIAIVACDQSARIRIERELVRARDIVDATRRAQGNFVSVVSHELRTPLNAIIGFSGIVLKRSGERLDDRDRDLLTRVRESGTTLLAVIDGILTHASAESGELVLERRSIELSLLLPGILRQVGALRRAPDVALRAEIADGLPPVFVDPVRLTQLLTHLLANAIKFTRQGEVLLALRGDEDGAQVITVRDTGIGIPAERLEAIWTPFEQGDSGTSRRFGGTGLGLPVVRSLAQLMGLQLDATSRLGEGSTFTVRIPATWIAAAGGDAP